MKKGWFVILFVAALVFGVAFASAFSFGDWFNGLFNKNVQFSAPEATSCVGSSLVSPSIATSDSAYSSSYSASKAIDSSVGTSWMSKTLASATTPVNITFDFGNIGCIDGISLNSYSSYVPSYFNAYSSSDGVNWNLIAFGLNVSATQNTVLSDVVIKFGKVEARFIRLEFTKSQSVKRFRLTEFKASVGTSPAVTCTSFNYTEWSTCTSSGTQNRSLLSSSPAGCIGGEPVLIQSCTYVPPTPLCTESNWNYTLSSCQSNGKQIKTWIKTSVCDGGVSHPASEEVPCTYVPAPACSDSDKGIDIYDFGRVNSSSDYKSFKYDMCLSNSTLLEYYCDSGKTANLTFDCIFGCFNSFCLGSDIRDISGIKQVFVDGGKSTYSLKLFNYSNNYGTFDDGWQVVSYIRNRTDKSEYIQRYGNYYRGDLGDFNGSDWIIRIDVPRQGNYYFNIRASCKKGTPCSLLVPSINFREVNVSFDVVSMPVCSENDDGLNIFVKGTTRGYDPFDKVTEIVTRNDSCFSDAELEEAWCINQNQVSVKRMECPYGCSDGVCLDKKVTNEGICSDLIDFVAEPENYEVDGREFYLVYNGSYSSDWWSNGSSYNYSNYYASWSTSGNYNDKYSWSQISYNLYVFEDKEDAPVDEILQSIAGGNSNPTCKVDSYWGSDNKENVYYVCNWNALNGKQSLDNNINYYNRQIYWVNGNVLVQFYIYVGEELTDAEVVKLAQTRVNDFLNSIQSNEFEHMDWKNFNVPSLVFSPFSKALEQCSSEVKRPVNAKTGEQCSPNWVCKTEPIVCPEYGFQTRTCIDTSNCEFEDTKEQLYCNPGLCSGCYVPRWFESRDNTCVPYGFRIEQSLGFGNGNEVDQDTDSLTVEQALEEGTDELNLSIDSNGTAHLYVQEWGDKTYTFVKGDKFEIDASLIDEEGLISFSIFVDDVFYDAENYNKSYIVLTFTTTKKGENKEIVLNTYCDIDGQIKVQKNKQYDGSWAKCQNNYECSSNLCSGGECVEINDAIGKAGTAKTLVFRVLCRLANLFDNDNYNQCLYDNLGMIPSSTSSPSSGGSSGGGSGGVSTDLPPAIPQ